jgi:hypothetical protein
MLTLHSVVYNFSCDDVFYSLYMIPKKRGPERVKDTIDNYGYNNQEADSERRRERGDPAVNESGNTDNTAAVKLVRFAEQSLVNFPSLC